MHIVWWRPCGVHVTWPLMSMDVTVQVHIVVAALLKSPVRCSKVKSTTFLPPPAVASSCIQYGCPVSCRSLMQPLPRVSLVIHALVYRSACCYSRPTDRLKSTSQSRVGVLRNRPNNHMDVEPVHAALSTPVIKITDTKKANWAIPRCTVFTELFSKSSLQNVL